MIFLLVLLLGSVLPISSKMTKDIKYQNAYKDEYFVLVPYYKKKVSLLDMSGNELHSWDLQGTRFKLKKNGNLVSIFNNNVHEIYEYDWAANETWKYLAPGFVHHNFEILNDGSLIFWYGTGLDHEAIDSFVDKSCWFKPIRDDVLLQIDKNDKVLWEWFSSEHLVEELKAVRCSDTSEDMPRAVDFSWNIYEKANLKDWFHANSIDVIEKNKWFNNWWFRKSDKRFKPGNLIITSRHLNTVYIIDKNSGDIIWSYGGDELPLEHPHEAQMIPKGYPGAGNILIFDNGVKREYSRILEINPQTKKVVWSYINKEIFYSKAAGSQQRLKNGDTFISVDGAGYLLIVNREKEVVWDYKLPGDLTMKRASIYPKNYSKKFKDL